MNTASLAPPQPTPAPTPLAVASRHPPQRPFFALLFKAARETLPITIGAWLLFFFYALIRSFDETGGFTRPARLRDLFMDESILGLVAAFLPLVGLLFAAFQFRSLRQPDPWGFFVHRPISRSRLFALQSAAGLLLYAIAIGIPWLLFFLWCFTNPLIMPVFDVQFLFPYIASALAGVTAYFCAIVLTHRQASWLGTGFLPLIAWLLFIVGTFILSYFRDVFLLELIGVILFALAAWAAFTMPGINRRLALPGRIGLCGVLFGGTLFLAFFVSPLADALLYTHEQTVLANAPQKFAYPIVLADGRFVIQVSDEFGSDSTHNSFHYMLPTGEPLPDSLLHGHTAPSGLLADDQRMVFPSSGYHSAAEPAIPWNAGRYRNIDRILVDDTRTPTPPSGPDVIRIHPGPKTNGPMLDGSVSGDSLMLRDPQTSTPLMLPLNHPLTDFNLSVSVTADKSFYFLRYFAPEQRNGVHEWIDHVFHGRPYIGEYVELYDQTGKLISSLATDPASPIYSGIDLAGVSEDQLFSKPLLILDGVAHSIGMSFTRQAISWSFGLPFSDPTFHNLYWNASAFAAMLAANFAAMVAFLALARWYRLSWPVAILWAFAGFFTGPLLTIVFVGLYHFPTRIPCPNCQKPRPVTEPLCPHCHTLFPPPAPNGTEIFAQPA